MILVIAYGNSLRCDDGAGLLLAERLEQELLARQVVVERLAVHQLTPELAADMARDEVTAVVFVDTRAVQIDDPGPKVQIYPICTNQLSSSLGHHVNPATLLTYARLLYDKEPAAWMVTIPGIDFGHGEGLSPLAQQSLDTVGELSTKLLSYL